VQFLVTLSDNRLNVLTTGLVANPDPELKGQITKTLASLIHNTPIGRSSEGISHII